MDPTRRKILTTGAAATAMAAVPQLFAQQTGKGGAAMSFYEKGPVRIRYEEAGAGFPLMMISGGGLNSSITSLVGDSPHANLQSLNPSDQGFPIAHIYGLAHQRAFHAERI